VVVLLRMPATYFQGDEPPSLLPSRPSWQQRAAHVGKNVLGVLLILLGIILSLPGVPGQGVLTMLIGLTLVDFPGKRRFEQRIMRNQAVLHGANRIRSRFGKAPFVLDPEPL
jgi:cytochrome b561